MNNILRHCENERSEGEAIHHPNRHIRSWIAASLPLLAMTILLALPARAAEEPLLDIQRVVSESGIEAWLVEDHSVPVIAVKFSFLGAGAKQNDAAAQGLAQLMSNTMDEGAGDLDDQAFQKALADHSISLSFSSGRDHFGGAVKTLSKYQDEAFDLLHIALAQPRFDADAVERMRKANQSRIRSSLSDPKWIAARFLNDVAYAGHAYALNSGGTLTSLATITPEDLRDYHDAMIGRNNLRVAVAGDITAEAVKGVLDRVFSGLPKVSIAASEDLDLQNQGEVVLYEKDIPQTIISILQPGISRHNNDYHAAKVMNFILGSSGFGSRLTEEIREKRGLTYGIYSGIFGMAHFDGLSVSTSTKNESVAEMLGLIKAEFEAMREDGITTEELADAKAYLLGSLPLSLTSTDKIAGLMLSLLVDDLPIDYLDNRAEAIRSMSVEDVNAVAEKLLTPEKFLTVLVGQPDGVEPSQIRSEIPNVE
ncbi:MAG: M16 family metallopeptidase [Alphaproteobacteria bacterium]